MTWKTSWTNGSDYHYSFKFQVHDAVMNCRNSKANVKKTKFLGLFENLWKPCLGSCSVDLLRIPDAKMRTAENRKWRRVLHGSQVTCARRISSNGPDGFSCKYHQHANWASNWVQIPFNIPGNKNNKILPNFERVCDCVTL